MTDTSKKKLHILQHSLGVNEYGEGEKYRKHFCTGPGSDDYDICCELVSDGLMVNRGSSDITGGDDCFIVTQKGIDFVALNSPTPPSRKKLTRSQERYQNYLHADTGLSFAEYIGVRRK